MGFKSKYSGRQLEEKLDSIKNINVVDALDSEDGGAALSANMGRELKEMIDNFPSGGSSTPEVFIGDEIAEDSQATLWIDTDDESGETSGENSGGGLETRILYVPEFTAGSELTDEEKAYNVETCQKLLAGTARAALSLEGDVAGSYALNTYCEDILDLSVLGDEGYYIPFKWTYVVQLGATVVGPDGDILLFGGGQSTTVSDLILNEDLSNLGDIASAVMEQYNGGKLPMVYYVENDMGSLLQLVPLHPFGTFSNAAIVLQGIGESFGGNEQTKYVLSCYNAALNQPSTFEATPIATKIYIGKPSTEHKNINKAFANRPIGALGINPMPTLVYEDSSSAEILCWKSYQPLEKYIVPNLETGDWGDYTHIEFLIFREGKYERWKLDMEGITSLIE